MTLNVNFANYCGRMKEKTPFKKQINMSYPQTHVFHLLVQFNFLAWDEYQCHDFVDFPDQCQ